MGAVASISKRLPHQAETPALKTKPTKQATVPLLTHIIPESVLIQIFSEWLHAEEVSMLDMAYANHAHRPSLLKTVQLIKTLHITRVLPPDALSTPPSRYCAFLDKSYVLLSENFGYDFVSWMSTRGIQQQLHVDLSLDGICDPFNEECLAVLPEWPLVTKLRLTFEKSIPEKILNFFLCACPNAAHVYIRIFDLSDLTNILDLSAVLLRNEVVSLSLLWKPRKFGFARSRRDNVVRLFDEPSSEQLTSFFELFGNKIIELDDANSSDSIPGICQYCPNLIRLPTLVSQDSKILCVQYSIWWPYLQKLSNIRELNLSLFRSPLATNIFESILHAYTYLEVVCIPPPTAYRSLADYLSDIASVFRHCRSLTSLNAKDDCNFLHWNKYMTKHADFRPGPHQAGPELCMTFHQVHSLMSIQGENRDADKLALLRSFIVEVLPTVLLTPIRRCVIHRSHLSNTVPSSFMPALYEFLQSAPCCIALEELVLQQNVTFEFAKGLVHGSLPSVKYLVLEQANFRHVLASGMLICLPHVNALQLELRDSMVPCQELGVVTSLLPYLVELEINMRGEGKWWQPQQLLAVLLHARSGRVWERLEFKMTEQNSHTAKDTFAADLKPFIDAIGQDQLKVKQMHACTFSFVGALRNWIVRKQFHSRGKVIQFTLG